MKLLFLEITKKQVRLRGTNISLATGLAITTLLSLFGPRSVAADKPECRMPQGDFSTSCKAITLKLYDSIDPNVPQTCVLTATCPTMFSGLPSVHNSIFIPAHVLLEDVVNQNGTLAHSSGKPLSKKAVLQNNDATVNPDDCLPPKGSYRLTCRTQRRPYTSIDPNLASADLCQAESKCATIRATQTTSMIYYNIPAKNGHASTEVLENCDGALVKGIDDKRCQINDPTQIKQIANDSGRKSSLTL